MKKGQLIVVNGWKLVDKDTGATLQAGVKRKDFRGDSITVWGGQPPHREGTEGRIQTDKEGFGPAYYASVVNAQWLKSNPRKRKAARKSPRKIRRYIPLHRVLKGNPVRQKLHARPFAHSKRARSAANAVVAGLKQIAAKNHVCITMDGKTVMQSKDTPAFRELAKRYAKTLARKHRGSVIKVVAY